MPEKYCGPCGVLHPGPIDDQCVAAGGTRDARGTRSANSKMAAGESDQEVRIRRVKQESTSHDDVVEDLRKMRITSECELLKEVEALEHTRRMEELYARKAAVLAPISPPRGRDVDRRRRHGRRHHRRSTSGSSSGSRTPSESRRQRSKWSLKRYTSDKKVVRKLTPPELIEASCLWMVDQKNVTAPDYVAFLKHVAYLAGKDKCDKFSDSAHVCYDTAVRKVAEEEGFKAFRRGDPELSIVHFSIENFKVKTTGSDRTKQTSRASGRQDYSKDGKRPCFRWNREAGCDDTACEFGHHCGKCGSKNHKKTKCSRD